MFLIIFNQLLSIKVGKWVLNSFGRRHIKFIPGYENYFRNKPEIKQKRKYYVFYILKRF
jgi:hypothetical protein